MNDAYAIDKGTMEKKEHSLYFGDTGGYYSLGGFITDNYIELTDKNSIIFNGNWTGGGTAGSANDSRPFDVVLIDESGNVYKVHHQLNCNINGDITVDISSYNNKYKIAFFCYSGVTPATTEYTTVYSIQFA